MTRGFVLALLITLVAACKKHEAAAIPAPPPADAAATTTPADAPPPTAAATPAPAATMSPPGPPKIIPTEATVIENTGDINATLGELSAALRAYVSSTRGLPNNFADFAARDHLQAPPPPAGKAYAISRGQVILVNQ